MLTHPTSERLIALGLTAMARALDEQRRAEATFAPLGFEDRLGLLVDREAAERETKRLTARLKAAALRQAACVEDLDLRTPRGIDRAVMAHLIEGGWIGRHENLLITGPTDLGKSWIACALGHKACRDGRPVAYHRVPRLFEALAIARGDGRHARMLRAIAKSELLILDDWGLSVLTATERRDLSKSSKTATDTAQPLSPANSPSSTGTRPSAIQPWPTPSSTGSSTMHTASPSQETA